MEAGITCVVATLNGKNKRRWASSITLALKMTTNPEQPTPLQSCRGSCRLVTIQPAQSGFDYQLCFSSLSKLGNLVKQFLNRSLQNEMDKKNPIKIRWDFAADAPSPGSPGDTLCWLSRPNP
jgi:hypothetical protein